MNTKNPHSASKAVHFAGTCNFIGLFEGLRLVLRLILTGIRLGMRSGVGSRWLG